MFYYGMGNIKTDYFQFTFLKNCKIGCNHFLFQYFRRLSEIHTRTNIEMDSSLFAKLNDT